MRELSVTHYITMSCFAILTHFVTYMVWLRTSNVAASWLGFGKDCGGVGDNRQLKWNLCKSILLLHSSVFHFFVVTLWCEALIRYNGGDSSFLFCKEIVCSLNGFKACSGKSSIRIIKGSILSFYPLEPVMPVNSNNDKLINYPLVDDKI